MYQLGARSACGVRVCVSESSVTEHDSVCVRACVRVGACGCVCACVEEPALPLRNVLPAADC